MDTKKADAIEAAMVEIEKHFGKVYIMHVGKEAAKMHIASIPTGSGG